MNVENALYPTRERMTAFGANGETSANALLNLLKVRDLAEHSDGRSSTLSGRQAYNIYGEAMRGIVEEAGGKFLFYGDVTGLVIGEIGELWDAAALVRYPSSADFARIAMLPEVQQIGIHRAAGLKGQLLIRVASTHIALLP